MSLVEKMKIFISILTNSVISLLTISVPQKSEHFYTDILDHNSFLNWLVFNHNFILLLTYPGRKQSQRRKGTSDTLRHKKSQNLSLISADAKYLKIFFLPFLEGRDLDLFDLCEIWWGEEYRWSVNLIKIFMQWVLYQF